MSDQLTAAEGTPEPPPKPKSGRSRPRARLVCTSCRQRKVKCDAEKISPGAKCTPCRGSNTECIVNWNDDRRRKSGPSYQRLIEMQERLQSLESIVKASIQPISNETIEESQSEISQPPSRRQSSIVLPSHSLPLSQSPTNFMAGQIHPPEADVPDVHDQRSSGNWNLEPCNYPHQQPPTNTDQISQDSFIFSTSNTGASEMTPAESEYLSGVKISTALNKDSNISESNPPQIDTEEESGELRFYGKTTQPHIRSPVDDNLVIGDEDDLGADLSLNMDSLQLRKSLLNTFFKIQPHSQIIVDEELFNQHRRLRSRSRYYSMFLEDAILAAGSRHSTSSAVRLLGKRYAERAKSQIGIELEKPNIASLQGFLLLSDFEATKGRARTGWTYSVIATGLMVDLGLHVDCSSLVRDGRLTKSEADFRDTLLLGTFVYATLWSLYLGRPNSISLSVLSAVRRVAAATNKVDTLHVWVGLCTQMLEVIDILNGPSSLGSLNRNTLLRLWELDSSLRSFFQSLPAHLALEDSRIEELDANAYGLQMQFCGIQITLHLAMIKSEHLCEDPSAPNPKERSCAAEQLYRIVSENAVRISRLVLSYRRIFGLENMITVMLDNIFVAAIALISLILRAQQQGKSPDKDIRWLRLLFETLESIHKHYSVTARMISSLTRILARTSLASLFPSKTVPSPGSVPESMTGLVQISSDPTEIYNANLQTPAFGGSGPSNLDFTLTDEDNLWLHETGWNMTTWPIDQGSIPC